MKDLAKLGDADLAKELAEVKALLQKEKFKSNMSRSKNTKELSNLRKKVAKLMTEVTLRKFSKEDALEN